jgi:hypothetical protein
MYQILLFNNVIKRAKTELIYHFTSAFSVCFTITIRILEF